MSPPRLKHRRDGNHAQMVEILAYYGWHFHDTSQGSEKDGPDGFAAKHGRTVACEFKMPGEPLRKEQAEWMDAWPGETAVIRTLEDVARMTTEEHSRI